MTVYAGFGAGGRFWLYADCVYHATKYSANDVVRTTDLDCYDVDTNDTSTFLGILALSQLVKENIDVSADNEINKQGSVIIAINQQVFLERQPSGALFWLRNSRIG